MKIIYVHGLDSSANSMKGLLLEEFCQKHHPEIEVIRPDLNDSPDLVFQRLIDVINALSSTNKSQPVAVIGSSLGGYFASLVSNVTGCPAILLNPSTRPHISLQRFVDYESNTLQNSSKSLQKQTVVYQTSGGWAITLEDLDWFSEHKLQKINYPQKVYAIIKAGDELLDPQVATDFYQSQGVVVNLQQGGDHRMTDFAQQLPLVIQQLKAFLQ